MNTRCVGMQDPGNSQRLKHCPESAGTYNAELKFGTIHGTFIDANCSECMQNCAMLLVSSATKIVSSNCQINIIKFIRISLRTTSSRTRFQVGMNHPRGGKVPPGEPDEPCAPFDHGDRAQLENPPRSNWEGRTRAGTCTTLPVTTSCI
jgi:hypothetical protein